MSVLILAATLMGTTPPPRSPQEMDLRDARERRLAEMMARTPAEERWERETFGRAVTRGRR